MFRWLISLFIALLFFTAPSRAVSPADTSGKSLLWQISGKDLVKPSYLFGTIHMICPDDYIWSTKMQQAFSKADDICFEMDLDDPAVMMTIATGMLDNSGKTLQDYFSAADYKKLSAYIKDSLGLTIEMFSTMKPMILPMIFTGKSAYCDIPVSYEEKLTQSAKEQKKDIAGIETPEEQIAVLNSMPVDSVVKEVMDIVNGVEQENDSLFGQLMTAYKTQDLPTLYELMHRSKDLENEMGAFLDDRNIKWIPRMIDMMDKRSMFFAVGAGHLWGEKGVIHLLRAEGYIVTPVR
jgi:uncharacterized protein YbaP (TraB family)